MIQGPHGRILTFEELATKSSTFNETEHRFYGTVKDLSMFRIFPKEDIEQWTIRLTDPEQVSTKLTERVRKSVKDNKATYSSCKKVGVFSNERLTDKDDFEFFKAICKTGQVKTRISIPIQGRGACWELDLYRTPDLKSYYSWVTVELEVDDLSAPLPKLPDGFKMVYDERDKSKPTRDAVWQLYEKYFIFRK